MPRRGRLVALVITLAVVLVAVAAAGAWLVDVGTDRLAGARDEPPEHQQGASDPDVHPQEGEPGGGGHGDARPPGVPDDAEAAIVDRVVDGDTIRVVAAPGGSIPAGGSIRVRLLNIDTPELARDGQPAQCGAEEARDRIATLLVPGDLVWLAADREDRDRFDRPLRGAWTADGVFVNELLAEEGYAEPLLIPPNDRFHARIAAAADRAQRAGRGIWGAWCPG